MRTVGIITSSAAALAALAAAIVAVMSIPDITRYIRIRNM